MTKAPKLTVLERALALADEDDVAVLETHLEDPSVGVKVGALMRLLELQEITWPQADKRMRALGQNHRRVRNEWMRMRAGSPNDVTKPEVLSLLLTLKADEMLANAIMADANFTEDQLRIVVKAKMSKASWAIAQRVDLTIDWLELFSAVPSHEIRVWWDENTPPPGPGEYLSGAGEYLVRSPQLLVAINAMTPDHVLKKLSRARSQYVRAAVITRPETDPSVLEAAAQDKAAYVRKAVAEHLATPAHVWLNLAGDVDEEVRQAVLARPDVTDAARAAAALMS